MPIIPAENIEITIHDGSWELRLPGSTQFTPPLFQVTRGAGVVEYTPGFGESHKLPGTVLSVEYIQAVVIGYETSSRRWRLGFFVARSADEKPRWLELVRWPAGDNLINGASAQEAGRELAEHIGCPLKIFGAKKPPRPTADPATGSGVTGPLTAHKRENIDPQQVKLTAHSVKLPLEHGALWLGRSRDNLILRIGKDAPTGKSGIVPSFNQCVFAPDQNSIRLQPPTGLLSFLSGQRARELKTDAVRNVELRHTIRRESDARHDTSNLVTEVTFFTYLWDIYLTLADESLLLAQTTHITSSELLRQRATSANKFSVNSQAGIEYLRQHQADQEAKDKAAHWAESAAIVIAGTLGVHLVKTEVEEGKRL